MTLNELPPIFCWSKMGAESGEDLVRIIQRKEWERRLGRGYFFWGVGHSLGENGKTTARDIPDLRVFFSPMLSRARIIDATPDRIVLWNAWVDERGQTRKLPSYCLITSRASLPSGRHKKSHYALVCFSDRELKAENDDLRIFPDYLRNLTTDKPLGASQVTTLVRVLSGVDETCEMKSYPVSFTAELRFPYCVRLAWPRLLDANELVEIKSISESGDVESWDALVKCLRSRMVERAEWVQGRLELGETDRQSDFDKLNPLECSEMGNV